MSATLGVDIIASDIKLLSLSQSCVNRCHSQSGGNEQNEKSKDFKNKFQK